MILRVCLGLSYFCVACRTLQRTNPEDSGALSSPKSFRSLLPDEVVLLPLGTCGLG